MLRDPLHPFKTIKDTALGLVPSATVTGSNFSRADQVLSKATVVTWQLLPVKQLHCSAVPGNHNEQPQLNALNHISARST
jgi:hypothetical protein